MEVQPEISVRQSHRDKAFPMRAVYGFLWRLAQVVLGILFRFRILNRERIPPAGPLIIAANHASYIDPVFIGAAMSREINYLAREPAFRFPVWGDILRYFNAIPLRLSGNPSAGLRAGLLVLEKGKALLLFPEGVRTFDGNIGEFRAGAGLMVAKTGIPVLPVRLFGAYEAYGRHMRFPRPRRVTIKIGHPLSFEEQFVEARTASNARLREIYAEIAEEIRESISRLAPDAES